MRPGSFRNVLVPVDGSKNSDRALSKGIEIAQEFGSALTLVHVVDDYILDFATAADGSQIPRTEVVKIKKKSMKNAEEILRRQVKKAKKRNLDCKEKITVGNAAEKILAYSRKGGFDLIVMGARGLGTFKQMLLGSVSANVSANAICPVLVVK